jgi:transposase
MRQGTFALSQKELQRVAVISSCVKGNLACARAASLLNLTPRHVKRLKSRLRQGGEAALAHASRGRPSHRRLPDRVRDRILHLARTTYVGFNDHHLCEKLVEKEGFSLGRETLRRLLRSAGIGSPRKRRAPTHRQRRLPRAREGEMVLLDASLHRWLEDRGPQLTLLGFLDDATRKVLVAEFFPTEDARGYFCLLHRLLRRFLPDHNRHFGHAPRETEKAWRSAPENLDRICCFHHQRSVSNDNVVQWDGRRFQIPPQPQRFSFAGAKLQLVESLDGKISIYYADTKLLHSSGEIHPGGDVFIGPLG